MKLPFHPLARAELREAVAYLGEHDANLADALSRDVANRVLLARVLPGTGRRVPGFAEQLDVRQHLVRRFQYLVVTAIVAGPSRHRHRTHTTPAALLGRPSRVIEFSPVYRLPRTRGPRGPAKPS